MVLINSTDIKNAVFKLCCKANSCYDKDLYNLVLNKCHVATNFSEKQKLKNILINANLAYESHRPLCQDTGQVIVFVSIGQDVHIVGDGLHLAINKAVRDAYTQNFYRKSVVKNALFDRQNTDDNTPAIIYTELVEGDSIEINLLVKGAGSENYSCVKMFNPSSERDEIFDYIKETIKSAGEKSCPPYVVGIGCGGTLETAALLSKKAFFKNKYSEDELLFIKNLLNYLGDISNLVLDIKLISTATHIASLPIAITMSCHSTRHASCIINGNNICYNYEIPNFEDMTQDTCALSKVHTSDFDAILKLGKGEQVLLSGEIYTMRDAAHQKLFDIYSTTSVCPIDLKNKIIFYAGPCPAASGEVIGPIGPTTSIRMDKYTDFILGQGVLGMIGKGERTACAVKKIESANCRYFTIQGGISCLLKECISSSEVIAFDELGTEAIRKLVVDKLPVFVDI